MTPYGPKRRGRPNLVIDYLIEVCSIKDIQYLIKYDMFGSIEKLCFETPIIDLQPSFDFYPGKTPF